MTERCPMGVGCDEAGVCYAEAHGEPDRCPMKQCPPHDWVDTHLHVGWVKYYECSLCGAEDERDVS